MTDPLSPPLGNLPLATTSPGAAQGAAPPSSAREQVVELLQLRFADDCLSLDEYERRVAAAYQARTSGELDALVADLAPQSVAMAVPEFGQIVAILSNNERNGAMPVPRTLHIRSILGNVELDLTGATFAPGLTEINISAVFGNVELTVPLGIRVECAGETRIGSFDCKVPSVVGRASSDERMIRITGRATFSSVEVRAAPSTLTAVHSLSGDEPRRLG